MISREKDVCVMSKKWGTRRTKIKEHLKKNKHLSFLGPFFLFSFSQIFIQINTWRQIVEV